MTAVVTIGVPVFNGSRYINRALESIRSQTLRTFKVIISDNASTDDTGARCKAIAEADHRFCYVRQEVNIGGLRNFQFLLARADNDYFTFLAADDYWEPRFLERNIAMLEKDSNAIASISQVDFRRNDEFVMYANGAYAIQGTATKRLSTYFNICSDNSRFYGVYRRDVVRKAFINSPNYHAADWCITARTLMAGDHLCVEELLMHREIAEADRYSKAVRSDNQGHRFGEYFPVLPLTLGLFHELPFSTFLGILWPLIKLNKFLHMRHILFRYGSNFYTRLLERI